MSWLDKLGGDPGANAFSTVTASFVQPAVGSNVTIAVDETAWIPIGIKAFITVGGSYTVVSVNSPTSVTIKNSGGGTNASVGGTVPLGGRMAPAGDGVPGATGTNGTVGANGVNAFSTLSTSFTQPNVASDVVLSVSSTAWMPLGINLFIAGGGLYTVQAIGGANTVTVRNTGASANASPGATVASGGRIAAAGDGVPGATGATGPTGATGATGAGTTGATGPAGADAFNIIPGATLTDATATIAPGSSAGMKFTLPAGTLTANRVLTLTAGAGLRAYDVVFIEVFDVSAYTYTMRNGGGSPVDMIAKPVSPGCKRIYSFQYDGADFFPCNAVAVV